ncbi:sialidase family protein [Pseudomonas sp. HK3]
MTKYLIKFSVPILLIIGVVLSYSLPSFKESDFFVQKAVVTPVNQTPMFQRFDVGAQSAQSMHSMTTVALNNGNLLAAWYGGTREGHTDVEIYSSVFNAHDQAWSEPRSILTRYQSSDDLNRYIKKVGNPVLYRHPSGVTVLFYVSVSMAGWATSQINMSLSHDDGQTWHPSKRLVLTPFLNISTLIKNDVITYADGSIGITAYHELLGAFSHLVRVDLNANVIDSYRMTSGDHTIQPSLMIYDDKTAVSMMRDMSHDIEKVQRAVSLDAGVSWSEYQATQVDNPNSAVFAFIDTKKRSWMIFNDKTRETELTRNNLALAVSFDKGQTWETTFYFENPEKLKADEGRYAYPWVTQSGSDFHIFYTWNREMFKHIHVNQTWLESLL